MLFSLFGLEDDRFYFSWYSRHLLLWLIKYYHPIKWLSPHHSIVTPHDEIYKKKEKVARKCKTFCEIHAVGNVACALSKDACEIFLWDAREQYDIWLHTKVNFMSIIHHHQICYKIKKCSNFEQKQINQYTETGHRYIYNDRTNSDISI